MNSSINFLFFTVFITLLAGCNEAEIRRAVEEGTPPPTVPTVVVPTDYTDEIVTSLQGSYSACVTSPLYPGTWNKLSVAVTNKEYIYTLELNSNNTCTGVYWRHTVVYEIDKAAYVSEGDLKNIDLNLKMVSFNLTWVNAGYIGANYDCGLVGQWVAGVPKDVTGLECAEVVSLSDPFHTAFKAADEIEYVRVYLGTIPGQASPATTRLVHPIGFIQSGDSAEQRKVHHTVTTLKL